MLEEQKLCVLAKTKGISMSLYNIWRKTIGIKQNDKRSQTQERLKILESVIDSFQENGNGCFH